VITGYAAYDLRLTSVRFPTGIHANVRLSKGNLFVTARYLHTFERLPISTDARMTRVSADLLVHAPYEFAAWLSSQTRIGRRILIWIFGVSWTVDGSFTLKIERKTGELETRRSFHIWQSSNSILASNSKFWEVSPTCFKRSPAIMALERYDSFAVALSYLCVTVLRMRTLVLVTRASLLVLLIHSRW